jgi:hypothetical protein
VNVYGHDSLLDFACRVWSARNARDLIHRRRASPAVPTPT